MTADARIIIVEDNLLLARAVARWLGARGYSTGLAGGIAAYRRLADTTLPDLVLLDLNLADEDGQVLAEELGRQAHIGLIVVSGRDGLADRVRALDAGADDYLVKPFAMDELGARVRAVLRRRQLRPDVARSMRLGPVTLDLVSGELHCEQVPEPVPLTERERDILHRLIACTGAVVERAQLVPGHYWEPGDRSVDVHVGHIRRKLAAAGIDMLSITSVRGRGYRLVLVDTHHAETAGRRFG
jgi:DNA-binding response OmpR family regulator